MASKKHLTDLQRQYKKEIKRLQQAIRRGQKRGYEFDESPIPEMPNRVTQSALSKIKQIKPKNLYAKADRYVDYDTGEIETGKGGLQIEKERAKEKRKQRKQHVPENDYTGYNGGSQAGYDEFPEFSDMVLSNYYASIANFPSMAYPMLKQWIENLIVSQGKDAVASMLEQGTADGNIVTWQIAYNNEQLSNYVSRMMDYLPEAGTMFKEEMMDAFEYGEDWNPIE